MYFSLHCQMPLNQWTQLDLWCCTFNEILFSVSLTIALGHYEDKEKDK